MAESGRQDIGDRNLFRESTLSFARRRRLVLCLKILLGLTLLTLGLAAELPNAVLELIKWLLVGSGLAGIHVLDIGRLLGPAAGREVRLQPNALELRQGRFTRFVVLEELTALRATMMPGEKVLSIRLATQEGGLTLRGFEDMDRLYAALAAKKPEGVIPEIREAARDLSDPLNLFVVFAVTALVLAVIVYLLI